MSRRALSESVNGPGCRGEEKNKHKKPWVTELYNQESFYCTVSLFIALFICWKYIWPVWETEVPGVWSSELHFLAPAHKSALCEDGFQYRSLVSETVSSPSCIPPPPCSACASAGQSEKQGQGSIKKFPHFYSKSPDQKNPKLIKID